MDASTAQLAITVVGGALSPLPLALCILLLSTRRPLVNAGSFLAGYASVLAALGVVAVTVGGATRSSDVHPTTQAVGGLVAGVLLGAVALHSLLFPGAAKSHKLFAAIDSVGPARAAALGLLVMVTNIKNISLFLAAMGSVAGGPGSTAREALFAALLVAGFTSGMWLAVLVYLTGGPRSERILAAVRQFLERHNRVITIVVFGGFAVYFLATSLPSLLA